MRLAGFVQKNPLQFLPARERPLHGVTKHNHAYRPKTRSREKQEELIQRIFSRTHYISHQDKGAYLLEKQFSHGKKLGRGAYANVYEALYIPYTSSMKAQYVALKILEPREDSIRNCEHEWAINVRLDKRKLRSSKNTLLLAFDRFTFPPSAPYYAANKEVLAFDIMDKTLALHIRDLSKMNAINKLKMAQHFGRQILEGLSLCHALGVRHSDLSPNNILVKDGNVKIIDFGMSSCPEVSYINIDLTYIQTRWWRAPEVLLERTPFSEEIDVWSAALIFYEIITNKHFLPGNDSLDQLSHIIKLLGLPEKEYFSQSKNKHPYEKEEKIRSLFENHASLRSTLSDRLKSAGITDPDFHDLMSKMLCWDPEKRLSAEQCLDHPFFKKIFDVMTVT